METVTAQELLTEVRRRLGTANRVAQQEILDDLVALMRDNRASLSTGQLLDLASLFEEEADRRFDEEAALHAAGSATHDN